MMLPILLLALGTAAADSPRRLEGCAVASAEKNIVELRCRGASVRLQAVSPDILRVRVSAGGAFPESLPIRWGFVKDDWPAVPAQVRKTGDAVSIETPGMKVRAFLDPLRLAVADRSGRALFEQGGVDATRQQFSMGPDEHFYGLGFQRAALDLRGQRFEWWRKFRSSEATVPFLMSTRGYGLYSNNTWRHLFDFRGQEEYSVTTAGGQPDYYVICGPGFKQILDRYTGLTGRPMLAPRWALGIGYQSRYFENQQGVLSIARRFRTEDIPIDWIGLEPGWEEVPYAMKWQWSRTRFPDPDSMIRALEGMGIKMGLWESGDAPKTGYTDAEARKRWYSPRIEAAIRKGIRFFKQDDPYPRMIRSQEMLPPEYNQSLGGSGVFSSEEMNNVTNSLYSETAFQEFRRLTGLRAMIMFNGYHSAIASHRWPFTWEADFPLGLGALSASLSGHSLVSTRDRNEEPDGIHLGYLAPFSYLESWAYYKEPWFYSQPLLEMNRLYVKLRYRLLPYLYSSLRQSAVSGLPLMRPMVLEFQHDREAGQVQSQFLLGDWLLVASARERLTSGAEQPQASTAPRPSDETRARVYLPKGKWFDYWTGRSVDSSGQWRPSEWPVTAGGPLWVKGGAIIPMGPVTAYAGQEPMEVVRFDVYPSGSSRYVLYEDDGLTYNYEKGAFAETPVLVKEAGREVVIDIAPRKGSFPEMPGRRAYLVTVHLAAKPNSVLRGRQPLSPHSSLDALLFDAESSGWWYDDRSRTAWVKATAGWRYDYDRRGAQGDPERDTAYWNAGAPGESSGYRLRLVLDASPAQAAAEPRPEALPRPAAMKGRLRLKASPPERVYLPSGGTWLKHRVTIYAEILDGGNLVGNADNLLRLHITPPPGGTAPPDREARAVRGVAVFKDIFFEPPAKYLFQVSGEGVEPASIPIY